MQTIKRLIFFRDAPSGWDEICREHGDLFNSTGWHAVIMKGFPARILYCLDKENNKGVTIAIFCVGPFRIGYVGFPVGCMAGGDIIDVETVHSIINAHLPVRLHCLRIVMSGHSPHIDMNFPVREEPETVIENLQAWHLDGNAALRRDVAKAKASPLCIIDADEDIHSHKIFQLYRDTIVRHKGNFRYTEKYFYALSAFAKECRQMRCLLAVKGDEIAGFLVVACHGKTAYYMHAGTNLSLKDLSPSDLLLYEAIMWAKNEGMERFNMMPSPPGQPSLIRYKEKWGGTTRMQKKYDIAVRLLPAMIFKTGVRILQGISSFR